MYNFKIGQKVRFNEAGLADYKKYSSTVLDPKAVYIVTRGTAGYPNPCIRFRDSEQWGVYNRHLQLVTKSVILIKRS